jgi:hypothetical protein
MPTDPNSPKRESTPLWPKARVDLLRRRYATETDLTALLADLNDLPGDALTDTAQLTTKAKGFGLHRAVRSPRQPYGRTVARPACYVVPTPRKIDADPRDPLRRLPREDLLEAVRMIGRRRGAGAQDLADRFGWPPQRAIAVAAAIRDHIALLTAEAA